MSFGLSNPRSTKVRLPFASVVNKDNEPSATPAEHPHPRRVTFTDSKSNCKFSAIRRTSRPANVEPSISFLPPAEEAPARDGEPSSSLSNAASFRTAFARFLDSSANFKFCDRVSLARFNSFSRVLGVRMPVPSVSLPPSSSGCFPDK